MNAGKPIRLVINADDFGYFPCVDAGILEAAQSNAITATGIIANREGLDASLVRLEAVPDLDLGVHLNLTSGYPLNTKLREKLEASEGHFPTPYNLLRLIGQKRITLQDIKQEWVMQIERCSTKRIVFLNSHEHIHMFPFLYPIVIELAKKFEIQHVRLTRPEFLFGKTAPSFYRNSLIALMLPFNSYRHRELKPLHFIGLAESGGLTLSYLEKRLSSLIPGYTYELMCHPGLFNSDEISEKKLIAYHRWEDELKLLLSDELKQLYQSLNIELTRYSELTN